MRQVGNRPRTSLVAARGGRSNFGRTISVLEICKKKSWISRTRRFSHNSHTRARARTRALVERSGEKNEEIGQEKGEASETFLSSRIVEETGSGRNRYNPEVSPRIRNGKTIRSEPPPGYTERTPVTCFANDIGCQRLYLLTHSLFLPLSVSVFLSPAYGFFTQVGS